MSSPTQDLRTLSIEERRALSSEAERRARAGEAPKAIRAALGISRRAYSSWAKLFGFRQCDLYPGEKRAGFPQKHPPGPGGYARSGRVFRGLPPAAEDGRHVYGPEHPAWTGGTAAARGRYTQLRDGRKAAARETVERLETAQLILREVRDALDEGDQTKADRLLAAWKARTRRARDLELLEAAAKAEATAGMTWAERCWAETEHMSDEELAAKVSRLVGREIRIRPGT